MNPKLFDENGNPKYTNALINEASPYLEHHAHNPVDWYPFGDEAFEKARRKDKPVLISIGYRSCHYCNLLAEESFEDEETAQLQNELFVNIKVDREERPDIDSIYMAAVQALTGQGGWPLNVFCLPDGTPFYGGTYFPPDDKAAHYRMPSWKQVLRSVAEAYHTRRDELTQSGRELVAHVGQLASVGAAVHPLPRRDELLTGAVDTLANAFDGRQGGFGGAPKFPQAMTLEFLLRVHGRGDARALPMLALTLRKMGRGGMYDQLGGGFHRYSTDDRWLVPHFEKMLYDNALLARLYVEAYQVTGEAEYRRVAEETLAYLAREMRHREGGFFSTEDADSLPMPGATHAEEGAFYVWTPAQVREHLGEDAALFCQLYDVSRQGNFATQNILHLPRDPAQVARVTGVAPERLAQVAERGRARLFAARARRPRPFRDEKIIAAWNGMVLRAFAVAAVALDGQPSDPLASEPGPSYLALAQGCANFVLSHLRRSDGRLLRSWKDGRLGPLGFLEDYAQMADGLLALYAADGESRWLRESVALADDMIELFWDETIGGFYDAAHDQQALVTRPRDVGDNATPSGNSVAAELLQRLAALTGDERYRSCARQVIAGQVGMLARFPAGFGRMLCAAELADADIKEVALVGEPGAPDTEALLAVVRRAYQPHLVLAQLRPGDSASAALTPLLQNRVQIDGRATAYVCQNFACQLPVTEPAALAEQLAR